MHLNITSDFSYVREKQPTSLSPQLTDRLKVMVTISPKSEQWGFNFLMCKNILFVFEGECVCVYERASDIRSCLQGP